MADELECHCSGRKAQDQRLIGFQEESDPIETTFELNDTLFAKAEVPPTEEVYIWLGVSDLRRTALGACLLKELSRPTRCCHTQWTRLRRCWTDD